MSFAFASRPISNEQPTGAQDSTTTEDGAYTLTPTGIANNTVTRNAGAKIFVTSDDEWYKAAYYDTNAMVYLDYPAGSDTQTTCAVPGATSNTANCDDAVADVTDVGSYAAATSPNGTFDQGGNVWERNETIVNIFWRAVRGGDFNSIPVHLAASNRLGNLPTNDYWDAGFRVASPVPKTPSLSPFALATLCTLLGLAGLRRLRE
jgi:hypothetical protein